MFKEKDEIFILNQPKRLMFSVIVVDLPLTKPLDDKVHDNLGWLTSYSDIFFIFPESHFPEQSKIDKRKFTSLYNGCGYTECSSKLIGRNIIKTLLYDVEILCNTKNHLGTTISRLSDLSIVSEKQFENLLNIISSGISRPIYTERRLSSSELFDIYSLEDIKSDPSVQNLSGRSIFRTIIKALHLKRDSIDSLGMYSTWHSNSPYLFFPKSSINSILRYRDLDKPGFNKWVDTFINSDPRYLLASLVNTCGLEILNMETDKVKL